MGGEAPADKRRQGLDSRGCTLRGASSSAPSAATDNKVEDNDGDSAMDDDVDDNADGATDDDVDDDNGDPTTDGDRTTDNNVDDDGYGTTDDDINNDCDGTMVGRHHLDACGGCATKGNARRRHATTGDAQLPGGERGGGGCLK